MALGFIKKEAGSGEDFLPSFRYNSISGDASIHWSEKVGEAWEKKEKEVKFPAKFIFDMENIEIGWMEFTAKGPNFNMVKVGQRLPEKPSDKHKDGFRVKMFNKESGAIVFASSADTVKEVMSDLHDQYIAGEKANTGKVPVVEIKGTKKIKKTSKEGEKTYKQPEWSIVSWVARPDALIEKVAEPAKVEAATAEDDDAF